MRPSTCPLAAAPMPTQARRKGELRLGGRASSGSEAEFRPDRIAGVARGDAPAVREPFEELHAEAAGLGVLGGTHARPAVAVIADRDAQRPAVPGEPDQGWADAVADGIGDQFRDEQFGGLNHSVLVQRTAETFHAVADPVPGGRDARRTSGETRLAGREDPRIAVHEVPPALVAGLLCRRLALRTAGRSRLSGYPCLPGEPTVSVG